MKRIFVAVAALSACSLSEAKASSVSALGLQRAAHPSLPLGLWRALRSTEQEVQLQQEARHVEYTKKYPSYTLTVPVDHFANKGPRGAGGAAHAHNATFELRYWFDASHYRPGGPVFCLDGGETSGADRLPFLDHGILKILSEATGGLGVVLEHRYYGDSMPVPDLSTDNLRWLTTAQALADNAYFTRHAVFPGLDARLADSLKSAKWIHYGGSYAGAKVALLRKLYPDVVYGAIASSAVTTAITDYWKYFEAIRLHAPQECVNAIVDSVSLVDSILALNSTEQTHKLKALLGVANLTHVQDVVSLLTYPLGAWQAKNWDPEVGSTGFDEFCADLLETGPTSAAQWDEPVALHTAQHHLSMADRLPSSPSRYLSNYARYIRESVVPFCSGGQSQDECFGTFGAEAYQRDSLDETWRSWTYQYCTEWGYLQRAAPAGVPSLLSRHIDLDYTHQICKLAFPPGKYSSVPEWPNTTLINQHGGFGLSADRIAYIDGSFDPWLYATPQSPDVSHPESTLLRPYELIPGGVHHHDENGLREGSKLKEEPPQIRNVHAKEIEIVKSWLGLA